ncbi:MAG: hypothetical protein NTZ49_05475 [Candidatus Parcubacteria bacterium]|nr:hypothetical protein [Candidatus Parcubacteria bacterium]
MFEIPNTGMNTGTGNIDPSKQVTRVIRRKAGSISPEEAARKRAKEKQDYLWAKLILLANQNMEMTGTEYELYLLGKVAVGDDLYKNNDDLKKEIGEAEFEKYGLGNYLEHRPFNIAREAIVKYFPKRQQSYDLTFVDEHGKRTVKKIDLRILPEKTWWRDVYNKVAENLLGFRPYKNPAISPDLDPKTKAVLLNRLHFYNDTRTTLDRFHGVDMLVYYKDALGELKTAEIDATSWLEGKQDPKESRKNYIIVSGAVPEKDKDPELYEAWVDNIAKQIIERLNSPS